MRREPQYSGYLETSRNSRPFVLTFPFWDVDDRDVDDGGVDDGDVEDTVSIQFSEVLTYADATLEISRRRPVATITLSEVEEMAISPSSRRWAHCISPLSRTLCAFLVVATLAGCGGGTPVGTSGAASSTVASSDVTTTAQDGAVASTTSATATDTAITDTSAKPAVAPLGASSPSPAPAAPSPTPVPLVGPVGVALSGLTQAQVQAFNTGRQHFAQAERPQRLGPIFNGGSCAICHGAPTIGGAGPQRVTRFGKLAGGVFDPMESLGGSLLQNLAVPGATAETVPATANVRALRRTFGVYGFGLIEAIPDSDITAYAKWQATNAPQQAGQVSWVTSAVDRTVHVGRFGWKCQQALLLDFSGDAYANEMGVSNRLFAIENRPNSAPVAIAANLIEDRPDASGLSEIDHQTNFMRFVAPYPSRVSTHAADDLAQDATLARGYAAFNKAACAVCHKPSWVTGGTVAELRGRRIWTFSDFLLHDVGTGDGIVQGGAPANKLRTAPLMGVATQFGYLHDGSARTLDEAIVRHGNEGLASRLRYSALTNQERADLIAFLRGL